MQYCVNNTFRDWANLSDTEGGHQPSVTVVDDDDDTINKKALKRKVSIATIVAGTALAMCGVLGLSLVWLGLAFHDLRKQIQIQPAEGEGQGSELPPKKDIGEAI